jgi:hypothetical protein
MFECHSIAMWHFFRKSLIGESPGSMRHPLHFYTQLHCEQEYPCLSTVLRTNGLSPFLSLRSSFQFSYLHQSLSWSKNLLLPFRMLWAMDQTSW